MTRSARAPHAERRWIETDSEDLGMESGRLGTSAAPEPLRAAPGSEVPLHCPACAAGSLEIGEDIAACAACGKRWPVDGGVPLLCRESHAAYLGDELDADTASHLVLNQA
ncbi:MAG: hypothetical protein IRY99_27275 [Isosphaeraceae bacterium]|nr:hypothetical protein [Isosphaeraceae bacterium]